MFPKSVWRLIKTPPAPGAWNMALDESILQFVAAGKSLPVLRLYAWEPACLSLGYAQPIKDVDFQNLVENGWELVRRPTGGRAILHTDELTYAVIAPQNEPRVAGSILESYRRLSTALVEALHLLDLPATADKEYPIPEGSQPNAAVCFEVPSNYEITVQGKKLIGSAQARRYKGVLQHGSLPLYGDLTRITQALRFENETERRQAAQRLLDHATTVEMILGKVLDWDTAAHAFKTAFEQVLNIEFLETEPDVEELSCAEELLIQKYAHHSWTERI
ncbi:MAG: lipoate--protein ligase family protein [Chloroflexota bacterium]